MSDLVRRVLAELRPGLERIYGPRLRGLYAFGSRARGDGAPDSDLDVLVVLDRIDSYADEVELTGALVSALSLAHRVSISRVFAAEDEWRHGRTRFLAGLRGEAVPA
jgi:predicted nucleotidyltransferase